ncbi:MAG TPA: hypothetical protein VLD18_07060 [Verrucomicrobiae bacterium]|nr:hypothetical protein [Verrucomicrobiae bacterium]
MRDTRHWWLYLQLVMADPAAKPVSPEAGTKSPVPGGNVPPVNPPGVVSEGAAVDPSKLSPEEQMALYEENLKETDWGHQPC